jgi:uncharacterized membrane protein
MTSFVSIWRTIARCVLGGFMLFAGVGHFRSTQSFLAQVPPFLPAREFIVQASGVVEIGFALALLFWRHQRVAVGWTLAVFYVLVFPGNLSQFFTHTSAFGLDTDAARAIRLIFQPVLVAWAIWCTGGWASRHEVVPTIRQLLSRTR